MMLTIFAAKISPEAFFTVREQTVLFLLSVVMGAGFGVIFDVFRALRVIVPPMRAKVPTAICDVIFFLICGFFVYMFSMTFARGEIRAYYWLGALLGGIIYLLTVGTAVMTVIRFVFGGIYGALHKVYLLCKLQFVKIIRKIPHKKELQNCNKRQNIPCENENSKKPLAKSSAGDV